MGKVCTGELSGRDCRLEAGGTWLMQIQELLMAEAVGHAGEVVAGYALGILFGEAVLVALG